jgi:hypothetical protein
MGKFFLFSSGLVIPSQSVAFCKMCDAKGFACRRYDPM